MMLWELSQNQLLIMFSFICCSSFICGWLSDRITGYAGFTVVGNWLLLLVGAYVGLYVYNVAGYRLNFEPLYTIIVAFASGLSMLMVMLSIKTLFRI